jgi:hypothetical protein
LKNKHQGAFQKRPQNRSSLIVGTVFLALRATGRLKALLTKKLKLAEESGRSLNQHNLKRGHKT